MVAWDDVFGFPIVINGLDEQLNLFPALQVQRSKRDCDLQVAPGASGDGDGCNFPPTPCGLVLVSIPRVKKLAFAEKIRAAQTRHRSGRMKTRGSIQIYINVYMILVGVGRSL